MKKLTSYNLERAWKHETLHLQLIQPTALGAVVIGDLMKVCKLLEFLSLRDMCCMSDYHLHSVCRVAANLGASPALAVGRRHTLLCLHARLDCALKWSCSYLKGRIR